MPKSTVAGHPLHPMLIVMPAALIPFSFALDALHRATGDDSYADAAYYSLAGGLIGGAAAAAAGIMDYLTIEPETAVKRTANVHAALNSGAMLAAGANLLAKRGQPHHRGGSLLLGALATAGLVVSGWFGARMVYEQGMRVDGVSPVAGAPEVKLPSDEAIAQALRDGERYATSAGPLLQ